MSVVPFATTSGADWSIASRRPEPKEVCALHLGRHVRIGGRQSTIDSQDFPSCWGFSRPKNKVMATETLAAGSSSTPHERHGNAESPIPSTRTNERPKKRIRAEDSTKRQSAPNRPQLYAPFRALGLVTTHVPFVLQTKSYKGAVDGPRVHILTCLGNSWALWDGGKMTLLFVGE